MNLCRNYPGTAGGDGHAILQEQEVYARWAARYSVCRVVRTVPDKWSDFLNLVYAATIHAAPVGTGCWQVFGEV